MDWQPGADSKHTAQECHHVDTCGNDRTVSEQRWGQIFLLNRSGHIFISSLTPSFVFKKKIIFSIKFHVNCFTLSLQPSSLPHLHHINSKTQRFQRPFSVRLWEKKKCLKTSLTFRLSLKMTLPSTIACGNIIRPTLNFNWYAVPDSSRGNYHSVHNKSHNKHLENDFIIHSASIKVSYDPSETHTWCTEHNRDEMKTILCIW